MIADTSGKTLSAKLGITEGLSGTALAAPREILERIQAECPSAKVEYKPLAGVYRLRPSSFLWCFCSLDSELKRMMPALRRVLEEDGHLWISWPRKAAWQALRVDPPAVATEDAVRAYAGPLGLVDVKVCAVNESWSGLKLVVRKEPRKS